MAGRLYLYNLQSAGKYISSPNTHMSFHILCEIKQNVNKWQNPKLTEIVGNTSIFKHGSEKLHDSTGQGHKSSEHESWLSNLDLPMLSSTFMEFISSRITCLLVPTWTLGTKFLASSHADKHILYLYHKDQKADISDVTMWHMLSQVYFTMHLNHHKWCSMGCIFNTLCIYMIEHQKWSLFLASYWLKRLLPWKQN